MVYSSVKVRFFYQITKIDELDKSEEQGSSKIESAEPATSRQAEVRIRILLGDSLELNMIFALLDIRKALFALFGDFAFSGVGFGN